MTHKNNRPNILFLCTDQQRFDSLGCYGAPGVRTPNLDRLAAQGARFDTCYVQNPICGPSRASLFTGMYARNHGLWANGVSLPPQRKMFTRALADGGYDCGMIGKQHLSACEGWQTEPRKDDGYRVFEWAHDGIHRSPQNAYLGWLRTNFPETYIDLFPTPGSVEEANAGNKARRATPINTVPVEAHYSHWVAERAIAFIETPRETPFFLVANFFDPHHPFGVPEAYRALIDADEIAPPIGGVSELDSKPSAQMNLSRKSYGGAAPGYQDYSAEEIREIRATYHAMIALVDDEVGRILDSLERSGQVDNTLVVFTSDHGEMLGDHAMMLKGPMLYDAVTRVPLILRWPDRIAPGTEIPEIVQWIDLSATFLDVAGLPPMASQQGASLLPLATEGRDPGWRDWAICEYRDSCIPEQTPMMTTMLRKGDWKLIVWHGDISADRSPEGELYNLSSDPNELNNLFHEPDYLPVRRRMKAELVAAISETSDRGAPRTSNW
ncbi:MAG: sulfatase-like hydrolase/transferase [Hyphomicrobiaceae bacterium]